MEIELDPLSPVPIHQQIRDRVVEAIGRGDLRRGDALLSVRRLAAAAAVNPATVSKAYDLLRAEGLVATNAKSGTFVAADRETATADAAFRAGLRSRLYTLLAEGRAHGLTDAQVRGLCENVARELGGREGES